MTIPIPTSISLTDISVGRLHDDQSPNSHSSNGCDTDTVVPTVSVQLTFNANDADDRLSTTSDIWSSDSEPSRFQGYIYHNGYLLSPLATARFSTLNHPSTTISDDILLRPSGLLPLSEKQLLSFGKKHIKSSTTDTQFLFNTCHILTRFYSDIFLGAAGVFHLNPRYNFNRRVVRIGSRLILEGINDPTWVYIVTRMRCRSGQDAYVEAIAYNKFNGAYATQMSIDWPPIVVLMPLANVDIPYPLPMISWEQSLLARLQDPDRGITVQFGHGFLHLLPVQDQHARRDVPRFILQLLLLNLFYFLHYVL